jgi:hypothetical protein
MFSTKKKTTISEKEKKNASNLADNITDDSFFGNEVNSNKKKKEVSKTLVPKVELSHKNKKAIHNKIMIANTLSLNDLKALNKEIKETEQIYGVDMLKQLKRSPNFVTKKIENKIKINRKDELANKLKNINKLSSSELKELKELNIINNMLYPRDYINSKIKEKEEKEKEINEKIKSKRNELNVAKKEANEESDKHYSRFKSFVKSSAEATARVVGKSVKGSYEGYSKNANSIKQETMSTLIKKIINEKEKDNKSIENIEKNIFNIERREDIKKILDSINFTSINSCPNSISDGYKSINDFNTNITKNIEKILLNIKKYKKLENRNIELNKYLIDELNIIYQKKSHLDDPIKYYIQDKKGDTRYMNAGIKNSKEKIKKAKSFVDNFIKQIFLNLEKILLIKKDIINRVLYIKKKYYSESNLMITNYLNIVTDNYNETKININSSVDKYNLITSKIDPIANKIDKITGNIDKNQIIKNNIKIENEFKEETQKFLVDMKNKGCKNNKGQPLVSSNSGKSTASMTTSNSVESTASMTTSNSGKLRASTNNANNANTTSSANSKSWLKWLQTKKSAKKQ